METLETVVDQGVEVLVGQQIDVAAITTVATIRSPLGDIFFTAETDTAVATIPGFDPDQHFIDKLHTLTSPYTRSHRMPLKRTNLTPGDADNPTAHCPRITSYNVCYTKLLRNG